jgi:hypothetical protein
MLYCKEQATRWQRLPNRLPRYFLSVVCSVTLAPVTSAASNSLIESRQITLEPNQATTPISIEGQADGGYLVVLDTYPPAVIKLDAAGKTLWAFEERAEGKTDIKFRMATPEKDGGALICAARKGGPQNLEELPSVVMRVDSQGHQVGRLDSLTSAIDGGPFYGVSACIPWGDGYAVVANEKRPPLEPDDYGKISGWPYRNIILRLRADFSLVWRKPLAVHANPLATTAGPRVLPNGDLILPGTDRIFRLDSNGVVQAQSEFPACKWLKTSRVDTRMRFACARLEPRTASTIIEYDESLKVVTKLPLGDEDVGLPAVCELPDGTLALLGNDGSAGPFVQTYSAQAKAIAKYRFLRNTTEGAAIDCVAISSTELAVIRYIDQNDHFTSVVTWLQAK